MPTEGSSDIQNKTISGHLALQTRNYSIQYPLKDYLVMHIQNNTPAGSFNTRLLLQVTIMFSVLHCSRKYLTDLYTCIVAPVFGMW